MFGIRLAEGITPEGELSYLKNGVLIGNIEKNPKEVPRFFLCTRLEIFFTLNVIKLLISSSRCGPVKAAHPKRNQNCVLTPETTSSPPFYIGVPLPGWGGRAWNFPAFSHCQSHQYIGNVGSLTSNFYHLATKQEKLLQKRYAEFLKYPAVTKAITLPVILPSTHGQSKSELTFSVSDGMKWKVRRKIAHKRIYIRLRLRKLCMRRAKYN